MTRSRKSMTRSPKSKQRSIKPPTISVLPFQRRENSTKRAEKKYLAREIAFGISKVKNLGNREGHLRRKKEQLRCEEEQLRKMTEQLREQQIIYMQQAEQQEEVASLKVEAATDEELLLRTPSRQLSSSLFSKPGNIPAGFGHLPLVTTFDPTVCYEEEGSESRCLHAMFMPSEQDIDSSTPFVVHFENLGMESRPETSSIVGIQSQIFHQIQACQLDALRKGAQGPSFGSRKLHSGIVTESSIEDFNMSISRPLTLTQPPHSNSTLYQLPVMVFECEGSEGSLLGAVRQAATEGSNVTVALYECGLDLQDCVVPVAGTNGLLISFGVVFLLKETFPTFTPLCQPLRHFDLRDQKVITAYFRKMQDYSKILTTKLQALKGKRDSQKPSGLGDSKYAQSTTQRKPSSDEGTTDLFLDVNEYFCKVLDQRVLYRGLGMFSHPHATGVTDFYPGLDHMIRVLNAVYSDPRARPYAEYPLSLRTPCPVYLSGDAEEEDSWVNDTHDHYVLIYRNLFELGFRMGAPHRNGDIDSEALFQSYHQALSLAVACIHNAGIVHGDLYLSNVMWRRRDDADLIDIKLVDWDASHLLVEADFHPVIRTRLERHYKRLTHENVEGSVVNIEVVFGKAHDLLYLSALELEYAVEDCELWQLLASEEIGEVNYAFACLLRKAMVAAQDRKQGENKVF